MRERRAVAAGRPEEVRRARVAAEAVAAAEVGARQGEAWSRCL